mgnify:CR=1 FL=1
MAITRRIKNSIKIKRTKEKVRNYCYLLFDYFYYLRISVSNFSLSDLDKNIIIVTASDKYFFDSLLQLIETIIKFEPNARLIVYDIGLTTEQYDFLYKNKNLELKKFEFKDYPRFISERDEFGKLGAYAWKSIILEETLSDVDGGLVLWLDAGNKITSSLDRLKKVILHNNFYSPVSAGNLSDWCHQKTLDYFNFPKTEYFKPNLTGGIVGFNASDKLAKDMAKKWAYYSKQRECISPDGSDRSNHRQDQSLLSILFYLDKNINYSPKTKNFFNILVNQNPGPKVYLLDISERDKFKIEWLKKYNNISTNTISYSDIIWILKVKEIEKIERKYLKKKKLIINLFSEEDLKIFFQKKPLLNFNNVNLSLIINNLDYKEKILNKGYSSKNIIYIENIKEKEEFEKTILSLMGS